MLKLILTTLYHGPVGQRLAYAVQQINHYTVDKIVANYMYALHWIVSYPVDSVIHPTCMTQPGPAVILFIGCTCSIVSKTYLRRLNFVCRQDYIIFIL